MTASWSNLPPEQGAWNLDEQAHTAEYARLPGASEHRLREELEQTVLRFIAATNQEINLAEVSKEREASGQSWLARRRQNDCSGS